MAGRWNKYLVSILLFLSAALVIIGTYVEWPSFGPFYSGPRPTSFGYIEEGYQLLDLPILGSALFGCIILYRYWSQNVSGLVGLLAGVLAFLLACFHTLTESGSLFQLRWGYFLTLLGAFLLSFVGLLRLLVNADVTSPVPISTRDS
jgi:hypothetical protein